MTDQIYNYIKEDSEIYNRMFSEEEIQTIYDTYMTKYGIFDNKNLITHIEDFHRMKIQNERSPESLEKAKNWRLYRRPSVISERYVPDDFFCVSVPKSQETFKFLSNTLVNDVPFGFLTPKQKYKLIDTMKDRIIQKDIALIKEGERDNKMYIVEEGSFDVLKNNVPIKKLRRGDYFGEIALLHNVERTATVLSRERSKIWEVEQHVFLGLRANDRNINKGIVYSEVKRLKLYPDLTEYELQSFINTLSFDYTKQGSYVVVQDDEIFMFVDDGTVELPNGEVKECKKKDILHTGFKCLTDVEGSILKKRQRKLSHGHN